VNAQAEAKVYLTPPELAERFRTTVAVVRYWRHQGYGPKGIKVGARVLYPVAEVERFERELQPPAGARRGRA
jgi:hypothetical protein